MLSYLDKTKVEIFTMAWMHQATASWKSKLQNY